jgi:type III restriction enzyme
VPSPQPLFDRLEVLNAINGKALLTYDVRSVRISEYITSLFKITRLLSQSGLNSGAKRDVLNDIIAKIRNYIDYLKSSKQYDELVQKVKEFKMHTQSFDAFGATIDDHVEQDLFSTTNTDIERQFRKAESILRNEGVGNAYGKLYADADDVYAYMLDVILFTNDAKNLAKLEEYAKVKFHSLKDEYRMQIPKLEESFRTQYDKISSDADEISSHNFTLPQSISAIKDEGGKLYTNHLYVNNEGYAQIKLNGWEDRLIEEESKRADFVCWVRNSSRKPWALALPYMYDNETKKHYPDFIVVRKDETLGYMVDILEPHNGALKDNLAKAKGLAEYAKANINASRIQLIRQNSMTGKFLRLDLMSSLTRDAVLKAHSNEELDSIFNNYGVTE